MRLSLGPDLEAAREAALAEVDAEAARRRAALGGDTVAHALKRAEAARLLAGTPGAATAWAYPMLSAEVGITASTLQGVAEVVSRSADDWTVRLARIEAARLAAKRAARAAADTPTLREALAAYLTGVKGPS